VLNSKNLQYKHQAWVENWDPEDPEWEVKYKKVALKNLIFSIFCEHIAFSVWLLWSIIAINLNQTGFHFSARELFWLVAAPNLIGAFMRLPYTYAVTFIGGRNWTVISSLLLLIPCLLIIFAASNSSVPYWILLLIAATAGLGGGNFASSMANINFFYPERYKGLVLGINAAGGNIGVSTVQLLAPIVIMIGGSLQLQNAGYAYAGLSILAAICAWLFMDNLAIARSSFSKQFSVVRRKHTWIMAILYIGTFGSFIGYSAALPLLIKTQFPEISVAQYAFIGGLVGALCRPIGGWLADRVGGAQVTFWNFLAMSVGVIFVISSLQMHNFNFFLASFVLLFMTAGLGNGSTYRMIPAIFQHQALAHNASGDENREHLAKGRLDSAAVIGTTSSIGAFGGFLIPLSYGSFGVISAFYTFFAFYILCLSITWWYYTRKQFLTSKIPSLSTIKI